MEFIDEIIAYESGMLSEFDCIKLFSQLIKTGQCWNLQGHYGRTAKSLIDNDIINHNGEILIDLDDIE